MGRSEVSFWDSVTNFANGVENSVTDFSNDVAAFIEDNWNAAINQLRAQNAAAVLKHGQMFGTSKSSQANIIRAASLLRKTSVR